MPGLQEQYEIKNLEEIYCPHCGKKLSLYDIREKQENTLVVPTLFSEKNGNARSYCCPHCTLRIPRSYLRHPAVFISFYGKPASGKSHIITMMTKQFSEYSAGKGNYNFSMIQDQTGSRNINYLLLQLQSILTHPEKDTDRILPPTQISQNKLGCPYDTVRRYNEDSFTTEEHQYPIPFIYLLQDKRYIVKHKNSRREQYKELKTLSSFLNRSRLLQEKYNWRKGLHLCFLDIVGEFCASNKDIEKEFHVFWPLTLRALQIRCIVYDPQSSRKFIKLHNETNPRNQWRMLTPSDTENSTVWNLLPDQNAPTLVLISKFDECMEEFCNHLNQTTGSSSASKDFRKKFQNSYVPKPKDLLKVSEQLKGFLAEKVQDSDFVTNIAASDVMVLPISAMGVAPTKPENEDEGIQANSPAYFKTCSPCWAEAPMLWLIHVLEEKAQEDENWLYC